MSKNIKKPLRSIERAFLSGWKGGLPGCWVAILASLEWRALMEPSYQKKPGCHPRDARVASLDGTTLSEKAVMLQASHGLIFLISVLSKLNPSLKKKTTPWPEAGGSLF
jgi:hypothetical protein